MGKINSKYKTRFSIISRTQSLLSSYKFLNYRIGLGELNIKKRSCATKKVLMLGLDGVGKTDLFTRLICHDKQSLKLDSLPHPTIGMFQRK
jgi:GTPase SAR1 family protein